MKSISINPVGIVRSTRKKPADDNWDAETASIELDAKQFSNEALAGLSEFSHVEIIFHMDQVDPSKVETKARHPRNNAAWPKVGIFSQRGKNRPNQIGTTTCRILNVDGRVLHVEGLDALDGTPVLDIKPWVAEFAPRGAIFQPQWITELMQGYWRPPDSR
jgi:tRNA (adenine37-N6)-methyltransferase